MKFNYKNNESIVPGNLILLITGDNIRKSQSLSTQILSKFNDFRIIDENDMDRHFERLQKETNEFLSMETNVLNIIDRQTQRGIPSILYANYDMSKIAKSEENVIHINLQKKSDLNIVEVPKIGIAISSRKDFAQISGSIVDELDIYLTKIKQNILSEEAEHSR